MIGVRKLAFGFLGLAVLLLGYSLSLGWPVAGQVLFPAYASAVVAIVAAVVLGNVGEYLATKGPKP